MKDDINPNVLVYEPRPQDDGAVPVGPGPDRGMGHRPRAGLATPTSPSTSSIKEGAPILLGSACPVAKASINPLAHEFIKTLISAPVQAGMAKEMGNGPVNTKVDVNKLELRWPRSASAPSW